mmetsp:Transcript_1118/g.2507  ORF Transcript_1118/g.2507 Transcript_1118/m.2507 type:complete len:163 (+) Transcript_1118:242-730(+)|eukprot:CAMPEP_0201121054 /NCGR_PEP_ID=MMETSP0850-20130426/5012_1 /ASSEMBLY_ACC=CAM_ASM_000622 /TAXON_ID=183588 /ORGANISM="Pseudo-nitzschia fraudulenta, Strain WWA7" /LENGTH=162 /DNA_ID=CAMNT_0047387385 /DNA_START=219 /DNA_END=707 /DNA_ORIENTATION=+
MASIKTSCNACAVDAVPVEEFLGDKEPSSSPNSNSASAGFVEKLFGSGAGLPFVFHFPELDRFCHSGDVIQEAAAEGSNFLASGAEAIPQRGRDFAVTQSEILQSGSDAFSSRIREGWTSSVATLSGIPSAVSERWKEAARVYHETKKRQEAAAAGAAAAAL